MKKKLFCTQHEYEETHSDPHGAQRAFRVCENCGHSETLMYNFHRQEEEWVTGLFICPDKEAFIIASDEADYAGALATCRQVAPDFDFYPIISQSDIDRLQGKVYVQYFLADRWVEAEILWHPSIRKLLSLHHI